MQAGCRNSHTPPETHQLSQASKPGRPRGRWKELPPQHEKACFKEPFLPRLARPVPHLSSHDLNSFPPQAGHCLGPPHRTLSLSTHSLGSGPQRPFLPSFALACLCVCWRGPRRRERPDFQHQPKGRCVCGCLGKICIWVPFLFWGGNEPLSPL